MRTRVSFTFILFQAAIIFSCLGCISADNQKNKRPNIIIIYTDDMNFQDIGVVDEIVANIDFAHTIYELCGIQRDESEVIDGSSLLPLITGSRKGYRSRSTLKTTISSTRKVAGFLKIIRRKSWLK